MAEDEDRISQLGEDLRYRILSFLPGEEAINTSFLSRSWRDTWLSIPSLDLGLITFNKFIQNKPYDHSTQYLDVVHQIFTRRKRSDNYKTLPSLKLFIPVQARNERSRVNQLIDCAVNEFHVKELNFRFSRESKLPCFCFDCPPSKLLELHRLGLYELPVSILASGQSQITQLDLQNCLFYCPVRTRWFTLTKLSLKVVQLNQEILDSITAKANCPYIEDLYFYQCHGQFDTLKAATLKKLISVSILGDLDFKRAEINAPNLEYFRYEANDYQNRGSGFWVKYLGSVSKGLKELHFSRNRGLTDDWLNPTLAHFSNLQCLYLKECHNVKHLRISSTTLTSLVVDSCIRLIKAEIETPRLKFLSYSHCSSDIPNLELSASSLKKVDVGLLSNDQIDTLWHERFFTFLSNFEDSQEFIFQGCVTVFKYMMTPTNLRESFNSPLYGVKHLTIKIGLSIFQGYVQSLVKLIDVLLWLSPRPEMISIEWNDDKIWQRNTSTKIFDRKVLKFKYMENNTASRQCDRCKYLPVRCWQHCLAELTVENMKRYEASPIRDEHDAQIQDLFENITTDFGKIVVKFVNV